MVRAYYNKEFWCIFSTAAIITLFVIIMVFNTQVFASTSQANSEKTIRESYSRQYPKTRKERKMDEIGSVIEGGITFHTSKIKNKTNKAGLASGEKVYANSNKYLWQAALEVLNFAPIASVDSAHGMIITDWYNPKNDSSKSLKINILIKDSVISPEAISVRLFSKSKQDSVVTEASAQEANLVASIEDQILRRAKALYIKDKSSN